MILLFLYLKQNKEDNKWDFLNYKENLVHYNHWKK